MPSLPIPGASKNAWGKQINEFLRVAHNDDGSLDADVLEDVIVNGLGMPTAEEAAGTAATIARIERRAFDPRKNGAVGDGVTSYVTETAAFNDTIAEADGGWVTVSPGTYVLGQLNVTGVLRLQLDEGARLLLRPGSHTDMLINFTGTELTIRGPGIIDGNRANTTSRILIGGSCPEGAIVDIDGVHLKSFYRGARFGNFGGYANFSHNLITDQAQHGQTNGLHTTAFAVVGGEDGAVSPLVRTNFNTSIFDGTEDAPGTAPGGFFIDSRIDASPSSDGTGVPVKWEAIGNYFYGYGQNHSANEIGCLHSYPSPAQCRFIANHFEDFGVCPVSAKGVSDFIFTNNVLLNTRITSSYVANAGSVIYAPGYHAEEVQHYRAIITQNLIYNAGGTTTQGAYGVVVNATADSIARDIIIGENIIFVGGYCVALNLCKDVHVSDNMLRSINSVTGSKRGISMANLQGDIHLYDNDIDVDGNGVYAAGSDNTAGRIFLHGGHIKTTATGFPVEIRGVALAVLKGFAAERAGGGTAINVTEGAGSAPVAKLVYDRSVTILEGNANLVHANITAFEGQERLGAIGAGTVGAAAGTGAARAVAGDGDKGTISVTTGTSATTGTLITMTFTTRRTAPIVILTPTNAAAAAGAAKIYVSSVTTTGFLVSVGGSALPDSTVHTWNYQII